MKGYNARRPHITLTAIGRRGFCADCALPNRLEPLEVLVLKSHTETREIFIGCSGMKAAIRHIGENK